MDSALLLRAVLPLLVSWALTAACADAWPQQPPVAARPRVRDFPYAPIHDAQDAGEIAEIEMFVGESRVFPTPGVARIAVGNGAAVTADALDGKEVILFANAVGTSSLFIWNADGHYQRLKINIVPGDTSRHAREIAAFLSTIPKAKASVVGASIIVEGDELSDPDLAKIDELAKRYPQIINFTNRVGWEQMVSMDVKVVEFPVTALRRIGLNWSSAGGAAIAGVWSPGRLGSAGPLQLNIPVPQSQAGLPISASDGGAAALPARLNLMSAVNLGLTAQLDLLAQEGKAAMLAEPQLSTRSGSKASFLAGGEIPYAASSLAGSTVQFKTYGVKLDITPRVTQNGVIRAVVQTEVSGVDSSVTTSAGPALLSRRTDTEFNVRAGETIVLSGLLQREAHDDVSKVPFLGDIPVLGALFRSKSFQNKETELVIFITPTLAGAQSAGVVDRIRRTGERLETRMGPSPYLSEPVQPGIRYERPDALEPVAPAPVVEHDPTLFRPGSPATGDASARPAAAAQGPVPIEPLAEPSRSMGFAISAEGGLLKVLMDYEPLRVAPSSSAQALRFLRRNSTLVMSDAEPPFEAAGTWRGVKVGDLFGWIRADAVEPLHGGMSRSAPATAPAGAGTAAVKRRDITANASPIGAGLPPRFEVQAAELSLHAAPDVNSAVVFRCRQGDLLAALAQARQGSWTAVQFGEGDTARRGWVDSQWLVPVAPR